MAEGASTTRRWIVLAATLAGMAVTASLGRWQLDRAEQKLALQEALARQAALPPVELGALSPRQAASDDMLHRPARVRGSWMAQHTVYLDNRPMNGRPGFYVLTPLRLEGHREILVVQRGWIPRDVLDRTRLAPVQTPAGLVELEGRIAPPPSKLYQFSGAESGAIRQNLDFVSFSQEIGSPLWPVSFVQSSPSPGGGADGLLREWPAPAVDVHKHHGYAFQWFALCALMAGLYVWFQLIRPWRQRER